MRSHKDLDAWKKSMDMVDSIYKVTKSFPKIANRLGYLILINPNNLLESINKGYTKVNKRLNIFSKKGSEIMVMSDE